MCSVVGMDPQVCKEVPNPPKSDDHQIKGTDFEESFEPVVKLEAIRLLLAFVGFQGFRLFQMDVKVTF